MSAPGHQQDHLVGTIHFVLGEAVEPLDGILVDHAGSLEDQRDLSDGITQVLPHAQYGPGKHATGVGTLDCGAISMDGCGHLVNDILGCRCEAFLINTGVAKLQPGMHRLFDLRPVLRPGR